MERKKKLRPVLDGDFWMIGDNPDLGELQGRGGYPGESKNLPAQECVDHHIYQSLDGMWHLWGCIRNTAVGRILYHWQGSSLTQTHWEQTGEYIRAEHQVGESLNNWGGKEWIQSPFVVREGDTFFMFYGGHGTAVDKEGRSAPGDDRRAEGQICLMTSKDGTAWTRHENPQGESRIFIGPGETRDPCVVQVHDLWHMYYAGYQFIDGKETPQFYARTSKDLLDWSDWQVVHQDLSPRFGSGFWNTECPHVVEREGYYYLFRTENYALGRTHVFRSEDPYDFGIGEAGEKYVGLIRTAAPEIVVDQDGQEYITSNHDLIGGTRICKLKWVEA